MSIKYELVIYWSEEDQSFIVEVPELPGCMADGATYEQAVANAQEVIEEWIETAKELNRPIPEPRGRLMYAYQAHQADVRTSRGLWATFGGHNGTTSGR
jgi:predicted RNase H-like HicB family nuclease